MANNRFLPSLFTLVAKDETDSTNDDAKKLAEAGASDFSIVWARRQTNGRGRFQREWKSPEGNIFCTTILRRESDVPPFDTLSIIAGVAVAEAVKAFARDPHSIRVKWVNDVLVNDRKISGILCEGGDDKGWVVVGVGINVAIAPALEGPYVATCINEIALTPPVTVEQVLAAFCESLCVQIQHWRQHGLDKTLRDKFHSMCWRLNETIRVSFNRDKSDGVSGINRGIDEGGRLILELPDRSIRLVYAGDVLDPT